MDAIEVRVENVNLIEAEFEPETDIEIAASFNPVVEVNDFDYPQELVYVNQRIAQILQTNGKLVEWSKSPTHIQYRYAGDSEWVDLVPLAEIKGDPQTRDDLGLGSGDYPEFADIQVTPLQGDADGGAIAGVKAAWLGATAKSVFSYIAKILDYIYSIKDIVLFVTPRTGQTLVNGVILLDRTFTQYNSLTVNGALDLTVGVNPALGGYADGVLVMNGVNTPTYSGFTLWPTSQTLDITNGNTYKFFAIKLGTSNYITFTKMN